MIYRSKIAEDFFVRALNEKDGQKVLPPPGPPSVDEPISDLLFLVCNFRYYLESPFGTNFGLLTHVLFWVFSFLLLFCQNFDFQKISATHTTLGLAGAFIFWPRRV